METKKLTREEALRRFQAFLEKKESFCSGIGEEYARRVSQRNR